MDGVYNNFASTEANSYEQKGVHLSRYPYTKELKRGDNDN